MIICGSAQDNRKMKLLRKYSVGTLRKCWNSHTSQFQNAHGANESVEVQTERIGSSSRRSLGEAKKEASGQNVKILQGRKKNGAYRFP